MARVAVFVTFLIAVAISCASAYNKDCAVGPQYWCQSFQNAQDCGALRHCTDTVWRYDHGHEQLKSSIACDWCQKILENTHKGVQRFGTDEHAIQTSMIDGCKLLPQADISSKCTTVMTSYGSFVLTLMKHQRYNTLCKLMNICSAETIVVEQPIQKVSGDEESRILCHVVVRATHELHTNQHKQRSEIQAFLGKDCEKLSTPQIIQKCKTLVDRHGTEIYAHVASKVDLTKVCDYLGDITDQSAQKISSSVYCDVCQFVMSNAQYMLSSKLTEDKVLSYVDDQICTRLPDKAKKACRGLLLNNGKSVTDGIQSGAKTMLLCTRFQVCLDQVMDEKSAIEKSETHSFFQSHICEQLGPYSDACRALLQKDGTQVLKALAHTVSGNELCHMFGLCPKQSPLMNDANLKDDPAKCTRCIKDFTRRKHIAERLVNHSSEFLHHLCGQLPTESDCIKAIDDSFSELLTFIRAMDPRDICIQMKMCDELSTETAVAFETENVIQEEILTYLKQDVCSKLGSLSTWCAQVIDSEGAALLHQTSKSVDPHQICQILDVCPTNMVIQQCEDKCQCCKNKVDAYQIQIVKFLKTIVASTRTMCDYMPARDTCLHLADVFEKNVNHAVSNFDSQRACQILSLCTTSKVQSEQVPSIEDGCQTCQQQWEFRQSRFRTIFYEMTDSFQALTNDETSRSTIELSKQQTLAVLDSLTSESLCKKMGYCTTAPSFEPSPIQLRLRTLVKHQKQTLDERLTYQDVCSKFGSLKIMCEHLLTSSNGSRYALIYEALLRNSPEIFDYDVKEQLATAVNTDVCTACKNTVQSAKDFWINDLDTVRDLLLQACERCPSKDKCRDHYNKLYDAVKAYLDTIDANQFCQSFHLCSSKPSVQIQQQDVQCTTCIQSLNQRKETLRQGVDRLTNYFGDLCQRFQLKPCQVFLQQLQQSVDSTIKSWNTQEICSKIGFCSTTDVPNPSALISFDQFEISLKDDLEKVVCSQLGPFQSLCRQILQGNREQVQTVKINENLRDLMQIGQSIDENLLSAANQAQCDNDRCQCCIDRVNGKKNCLKSIAQQVFGVLIKSCDYCPAKDQCRQYWTDNQQQCISSIDNVDAKQICVQIGFCSASPLKENPQVIEEHLPKTSVVVLPTEVEKTKPVEDSNTTCILCEYMMKILSNYIHAQSTEEEIKKSLEQVCQRMPKTLEQQCVEFVDNYGAAIVSTLVQESDLSRLCQKLNICTKQMNVNLQHLVKPNVAACGVCDYVSTYVHFALKRDSSDASLQQALGSVCKHLSSEQSSQCETLVQLFGPQIRQLKLSLGENFCQQLDICQTPKEESTVVTEEKHIDLDTKEKNFKDSILKNLDDSPQCLICHYVISYLDAALKNNKSEEAIEAALERVCKLLPAKERAQCNEFVKTYGPVLAELISETADPDTICRYLGLCQVTSPIDGKAKSQTLLGGDHHDYVHLPIQDTPFTCTICQFVITRMKSFIVLNQTEEEILASLKASCDHFSVLNLKQQCQDFLEKYGPYLIQMVSSDIEPKVACQSIGACEKNSPVLPTQPTQSSSSGKCIFGMSYWCTSRQNAESCNAVELCERLVWSKKNKNIII